MKHWLTAISFALTLCASFAHANDKNKGCGDSSCKKQNWLLFGDSLFDTGAGNNLALANNLPEPSPQPPYANNRHSNGPIWVDYASDLLDAKFSNFAVTGSTTNGTNIAVPPLGGIFQQIARFQQRCCKSGIGEHRLVIMDGGANDLFALIPNNLNPAAAAAAVQQAVLNQGVNLTNLQKLGAKKIIIWNLPDLGKTPQFNDAANFGPLVLAKPLFTAASIGFNGGLQTLVNTLNTFAKDRQQIFILDAFTLFNIIEADLTKHGINIADHTLTILPGPIVLVNGPPPNHIAFYDNVHPTTFLWQIAANYVAAFIDTVTEANRFIAAEQDLAFATAGAHRDIVNNHYRTLHRQHFSCCPTESCGCDCSSGCGCQFYVDGAGKWGKTHTRCGTLGADYDTGMALLGVDFQCNECMTLGTSFTYAHSNAHVKHHKGHMELDDYVPTFYATLYGNCNTFVDVDFSWHVFHYEHIKRKIPFLCREAKGHTTARSLEGNFQIGHIANCNCWTFVPIAGLGVAGLKIDNYKEKGACFLNLKVRHQHQNSFYGKLGAQFWWNSCDCCYTPFGEFMYEHEFDRSHGKVVSRFACPLPNAVDNARIYSRAGNSDRDLLRFTVGLDARFSSCLSANISYEGETSFKSYANGVKGQLDFNF